MLHTRRFTIRPFKSILAGSLSLFSLESQFRALPSGSSSEVVTAGTKAEGGERSSGLTEIDQLRELILEQRRAIEEMRAQLNEQQAVLEALRKKQGSAADTNGGLTGTVQARASDMPSGTDALADATAKPDSATPTSSLESKLESNSGSDSKDHVVGKSPDTLSPEAQTLIVKGPETIASPPKKLPWYDKLSVRGYAQIRYNRLLETNPRLTCEQCDRSLGGNNGFFLRRTRLVLSGDVHERVYVYLQPDFASSASASSLHFAQLRDAYLDLALDKKKEFRFRIGQSKVPYGFEILQSSQNRIALDRTDAINSALANERDLGTFFYWAPAKIRKRFSELVSSGLKGTGDYGVFGIGLYNGQTANRPEANNSLHVVSRVSYPFLLSGGQIIEGGLQAYTGKYIVTRDQRSPLTLGPDEFRDERVAASLAVYPQPLGFQAEYNVGRGPEFNPSNLTIENRVLHGGYAQIMYRFRIHNQVLFPFVRSQYYNGGKKHELDARHYLVREHEVGLEWQLSPSFEWVASYGISDRTFEDGRSLDNRQKGNVLRMQFQFNY